MQFKADLSLRRIQKDAVKFHTPILLSIAPKKYESARFSFNQNPCLILHHRRHDLDESVIIVVLSDELGAIDKSMGV